MVPVLVLLITGHYEDEEYAGAIPETRP